MNLFRNTQNTQAYPADATICRQDEPGRSKLVIVDGTVEIVRGERPLSTLGPGEFFGKCS